jgi:iron complex outermembrane receptor protein
VKVRSYRIHLLVTAGAVATLLAVNAQAQTQSSAAVAATDEPAEPIGAQSAEQPTASGADIVVTGLRASQAKSIDLKRNADKFVDSIVAEDIGKLPDVTISDSLQRVTGVQVQRTAGEGGTVSLRGLPQVLSTLNGDMFLGAGNVVSTQPNYDDLPASLIAGVDVIKSNTADILPGGIAGTINLKTRQPLDQKKGWNLATVVEAQRGSYAKVINPNVSVITGYKSEDGRWGALISVNASRAVRANYNNNNFNNDWDRITPDGVMKNPTDPSQGFYDLTGKGSACVTSPFPTGITPGVDPRSLTSAQASAVKLYHDRNNLSCLIGGNYVWMPRIIGINDATLERQRKAASAALSFKITPDLTVTAETFYSKLEDNNFYHNLYFHNAGTLYGRLQPGLADMLVSENGVVQKGQERTAQLYSRSGNNSTRGWSNNNILKLVYAGDSNFSGDVRLQGSKNRRQTENASLDGSFDPTFSTTPAGCTTNCSLATGSGATAWPGYLLGFDFTGKQPSYEFLDGGFDRTKIRLNNIASNGSDQKGRLYSVTANGMWRQRVWILDDLKFGGRYSHQNIGAYGYTMFAPVYSGTPGAGYSSSPSISSTPVGTPFRDGLVPGIAPDLGSAWPESSINTYNRLGVTDIPSFVLLDPKFFQNPQKRWLELFPSYTNPAGQTYAPLRALDPSQQYRYTVSSREFYVQADFSGSIFGLDYNGNVGVRQVNSDITINRRLIDATKLVANTSVLRDLGPETLKRKYSDTLPNINIRVLPTQNLVVRGSINKAVTRPDINVLGQQTRYGRNANNGVDPNLPDGFNIFLSASGGNPDLKPWRSTNYNLGLEWYPTRETVINVALYRLDISSFARTETFSAPGPDADGVVRRDGVWTQVVNGTGTYTQGVEGGIRTPFSFLPGVLSGLGTDANFTYGQSKGFDTDLNGKSLPLPNFSKYTVNYALWFEKYGFQARVAANWRSERFSNVRGQRAPNTSLPTSDAALLAAYRVSPASISNARLATWFNGATFVDASINYQINRHLTMYVQANNITGAYESRYAQFDEMFMDQNIFDRNVTIGVRAKF